MYSGHSNSIHPLVTVRLLGENQCVTRWVARDCDITGVQNLVWTTLGGAGILISNSPTALPLQSGNNSSMGVCCLQQWVYPDIASLSEDGASGRVCDHGFLGVRDAISPLYSRGCFLFLYSLILLPAWGSSSKCHSMLRDLLPVMIHGNPIKLVQVTRRIDF